MDQELELQLAEKKRALAQIKEGIEHIRRSL